MTDAVLKVFRGTREGGAFVEYRVPVAPGMVCCFSRMNRSRVIGGPVMLSAPLTLDPGSYGFLREIDQRPVVIGVAPVPVVAKVPEMVFPETCPTNVVCTSQSQSGSR